MLISRHGATSSKGIRVRERRGDSLLRTKMSGSALYLARTWPTNPHGLRQITRSPDCVVLNTGMSGCFPSRLTFGSVHFFFLDWALSDCSKNMAECPKPSRNTFQNFSASVVSGEVGRFRSCASRISHFVPVEISASSRYRSYKGKIAIKAIMAPLPSGIFPPSSITFRGWSNQRLRRTSGSLISFVLTGECPFANLEVPVSDRYGEPVGWNRSLQKAAGFESLK